MEILIKNPDEKLIQKLKAFLEERKSLEKALTEAAKEYSDHVGRLYTDILQDHITPSVSDCKGNKGNPEVFKNVSIATGSGGAFLRTKITPGVDHLHLQFRCHPAGGDILTRVEKGIKCTGMITSNSVMNSIQDNKVVVRRIKEDSL